MKRLLIPPAVLVLACCLGAPPGARAFQGKGGQVVKKKTAEAPAPAPAPPVSKPERAPGAGRPERATGAGAGGGRGRVKRGEVSAPKCGPGSVVVRCNVPGCGVLLEGAGQQVFADERGVAVFPVAAKERHTLVVSLKGYQTERVPASVECGREKVVPVTLKGVNLALRIRTSPPGADIYVNERREGVSDAQGLFNHSTVLPSLLVEARKPGYLSANRRITNVAAEAAGEVLITLKPVAASVTVSANAEGALVRVGEGQPRHAAGEQIILPPGRHALTVEALGHAPRSFEVELKPDIDEKRRVELERLPLLALKEQAEQLYRARAYALVLKLCQYMLEADPAHPAAHRLAGLAHLQQQNLTKAEEHLARALAGGAAVELRVRRHPRESFDTLKGHDACQGLLVLTKDEVEFRGLHSASDNFKVPYAKVQQVGLRLKNGVALYLGTKISDARNGRRDYNFYYDDRELSQAGRPYLEMLQRLLRAH